MLFLELLHQRIQKFSLQRPTIKKITIIMVCPTKQFIQQIKYQIQQQKIKTTNQYQTIFQGTKMSLIQSQMILKIFPRKTNLIILIMNTYQTMDRLIIWYLTTQELLLLTQFKRLLLKHLQDLYAIVALEVSNIVFMK